MILVILAAAPQSILAQEKPGTDAADPLWATENLPTGAVFRYGAIDRNPAAIGIFELKFSPDGKLIAARDRRQNIRILDIELQERIALLPTQISRDFQFSPDNKFVVLATQSGTQIWSLAEQEKVRDVGQAGYKLAFASDPQQLVVASKGGVYRNPWPLPSTPAFVQSGLEGRASLPAGISQDGRMVAFQDGGRLEILDTVSGATIDPPRNVVPRQVRFSPNGYLMADMKYGESKLKIFDLRDTKKYQYVLSDKRRIVNAVFSNDSRFLYTSNYDNSIVIWDMVTMKQVERIEAHGSRIYALAASPNRLLSLASGAAGPTDRSVILWDFLDRIFPPIESVDAIDLDVAWVDLKSNDPKVSLSATNQFFHALQHEPRATTGLIATGLGLESVGDNEVAKKLIRDLDARQYKVRENATTMLTLMVEQARPLLERRVADSSQESKWRIQKILRVDRKKPSISTGEGRREHRIVLALELDGSADSIKLLEEIVAKSSNFNLVEISKQAIDRLARAAG
ncbi:WD40 repeat domain-containing protein [Mariniblastus fucicola]|uniref:WD domain, G-beta repeat n=2 Tax=Mariniblastus fucicola TaxID=980251 RepID=A0A5B9P722_9BACT|nr:hypothetical protein [Mariniblastus fucicola]QEG21349.1 WD domain, G-beta repeat [Mariniblastus fucicola]